MAPWDYKRLLVSFTWRIVFSVCPVIYHFSLSFYFDCSQRNKLDLISLSSCPHIYPRTYYYILLRVKIFLLLLVHESQIKLTQVQREKLEDTSDTKFLWSVSIWSNLPNVSKSVRKQTKSVFGNLFGKSRK